MRFLKPLPWSVLRDDWLFHFGFSLPVDFCVWVLETDGLRVPPFDQHLDGNGTLRAVGLTAPDWWNWFAGTVSSPHEAGATGSSLQPDFSPLFGVQPVVDRLEALWPFYLESVSNERRAFERAFIQSAPYQGVWAALKPYHARLECLRLDLIAYPWRAACALPPYHLVLSIPSTSIDRKAFHAAVLHGAERLAASPQ